MISFLLEGSSSTYLSHFVSKFSSIFAMKHLGDPHYFLGIEYSSGLFLSQTRYTTTDLLSKFHMSCANSVSTPIPVRSNLHSLCLL